MRAPLSLLLALPHLALSLPNPSSHPLNPRQPTPPNLRQPTPPNLRQPTPPNLPYPSGDTPATCPRPGPYTNLWPSNAFLPFTGRQPHRPNIDPHPPTATNLHDRPPRALPHSCQQVAGFLFPPLGTPTVKTQDVLLQPGKQYVFTIVADAAPQSIVVWAWDGANPKPGGQMRFVGSVDRGRNEGMLVLDAVESAVKVFFVVSFGSLRAQGQVGLFAIGSG